jgi:hypothetical protein
LWVIFSTAEREREKEEKRDPRKFPFRVCACGCCNCQVSCPIRQLREKKGNKVRLLFFFFFMRERKTFLLFLSRPFRPVNKSSSFFPFFSGNSRGKKSRRPFFFTHLDIFRNPLNITQMWREKKKFEKLFFCFDLFLWKIERHRESFLFKKKRRRQWQELGMMSWGEPTVGYLDEP